MRAFADLQSQARDRPASRTPTAVEQRRPVPMEYTSWGQSFVESEQFRSYNGHGQSGRFEIEGFLEQRAAITTANLAIPHFVLATGRDRRPLAAARGRRPGDGVVRGRRLGRGRRRPGRRGRRRRRRQAGGGVHGHPEDGGAGHDRPLGADHPPGARGRHLHPVADRGQAASRSARQGRGRHGGRASTPRPCRPRPAPTCRRRSGSGSARSRRPGTTRTPSCSTRPTTPRSTSPSAAVVNPGVGRRRSGGCGRSPAAAITAGKAYVGDFAAGATLFDRGVTNVFLSDSHASLFISNILVILAEARLKSAVTEPLAICECTEA